MVKNNLLSLITLICFTLFVLPCFAQVLVDSNLPVDNYLTDNTTPDFNFTYTGNEPIAFCEIHLNGFVYGNMHEWCYQETANVSTACGGLDTGSYACEGNWSYKGCDLTYDGSWTDSGIAEDNHTTTLYINYTIPENALDSSLWELQYDNNHTNNSIPSECLDGDILQLRVFSSARDNSSDSRSTWYCWQYGTSIWWAIIGWTDFANGNGIIVEEAIWWNFETTNASKNIPTVIPANPPLSEGIYNWYVNCTAGGITNQSIGRTLAIYGCPPCPPCNDSCLSEGQNDTIYGIYNQTELIYNLNRDNYMNPAFLLWIIIFLGSVGLLFYGSRIKKIIPLFCSTLLFSVLSLYSFSFIDIIGDAGVWIMIGVSMIGLIASLGYLMSGLVKILKDSGSSKEDLKL